MRRACRQSRDANSSSIAGRRDPARSPSSMRTVSAAPLSTAEPQAASRATTLNHPHSLQFPRRGPWREVSQDDWLPFDVTGECASSRYTVILRPPPLPLKPGRELLLDRWGKIHPTQFAGRDANRASILSLHFQRHWLRAGRGCQNFANRP